MIFFPFGPAYDAYGADLYRVLKRKYEPVYRLLHDEEGRLVAVRQLTDEEMEERFAAKKDSVPKSRSGKRKC